MGRFSYYGLPVLKRPHWRWEVATYFFLGGIAGGSYFLASLADLFGRRDDKPLVRAGRVLSFLGVAASPLLLVADLGRPERFHRMLRRFNFRSPMSVGAWMLTFLGGVSGLSLWQLLAEERRIPVRVLSRLGRALPRRLLSVLGMVPGFFVASYTGVLLSNTAVPFWRRNRLLGAAFLASSASTSAAAIGLASLRQASGRAMERLSAVQALAAALELLFVRLGMLAAGSSRKHVEEGKNGRLFRFGAEGLGVFLPVLAFIVGRRRLGPRIRGLVWLLSLVGGFLFRWCVLEAGKSSADDPYESMEE